MPDNVNIQTRNTPLVTYTFLLDGQDIKERFGVLSIVVTKELNRIPSATVVLTYDPNQNHQQNNRDRQDEMVNLLVPGKPVEINAGYQSQSESLFKGVLVKKNLKLINSKAPVIVLECKDIVVKTALYNKSAYFYHKKDSDIFHQILDLYPDIQAGTIENTSFTHKEIVQYYSSDWDFMVSRAESNGHYVIAENGQLSMVKLDLDQDAHCRVIYGGELVEFESEVDARTHFPAVSIVNWNYVDQVLSEQRSDSRSVLEPSNTEFKSFDYASDFFSSTPYVIYQGGDFQEEELSKWADTKYQKSRFSSVRGRVRLRGLASIKPNMMIKIEEVGSEFDGIYFVSGVTHQIFNGQWFTDLQLGLSTKWFSENAANEKGDQPLLYPGIQGIQTGIVTKVEGDERSGNHRIQVRIPYIALQTDDVHGSQAEGIWARLGTLYAGDNRGFVFRPEVDDEVILGFVNNDPSNAIILGALHSNKHAAPIPATAANNKKGFYAKSGMKLELDDDAKSIQIDTPQGFAINISEQEGKLELKDKNGNQVTLSSSGISLQSTKDISISATGQITIQGLRIDLN